MTSNKEPVENSEENKIAGMDPMKRWKKTQ